MSSLTDQEVSRLGSKAGNSAALQTHQETRFSPLLPLPSLNLLTTCFLWPFPSWSQRGCPTSNGEVVTHRQHPKTGKLGIISSWATLLKSKETFENFPQNPSPEQTSVHWLDWVTCPPLTQSLAGRWRVLYWFNQAIPGTRYWKKIKVWVTKNRGNDRQLGSQHRLSQVRESWQDSSQRRWAFCATNQDHKTTSRYLT